MNAFSYIRVSSKGQAEGDGPDRQRAAINSFAQAHRLNVLAEFFDAHTGTEEDRPAFSDMIDLLKNEECDVDCIILERMDRLARDLIVSEYLLKALREAGIKVFVADQGQLVDMASDEQDPTRVLMRQILGAIAQWEKSALVRKLRAARIRTGNLGGIKPFGHFQGELEVLRVLLELYGRCKNSDTVAFQLNALGHKTRSGANWSGRMVRKVLARNQKPEKMTDGADLAKLIV